MREAKWKEGMKRGVLTALTISCFPPRPPFLTIAAPVPFVPDPPTPGPRWNQTHSFRCSSKHVADRVRKVLEFIGLESDLVMNDEVMRGLRSSLKSAVCCEADIKQKQRDKSNFDIHLAGRNQSGKRLSVVTPRSTTVPARGLPFWSALASSTG